jgi:hypothetical protein
MADVISLAVIVAFFAFAALVVKACERIIGPDEVSAVPARVDEPERFAA